jgi:hypothetical protein
VAGVTNSSISCVDADGNDVGSAALGDPVSVDADGLVPGTYTCTVVVDP